MNHKLTYMCMISLLTNSVVHTVFIPSYSYLIHTVFIPYLLRLHTVFILSSYRLHTVLLTNSVVHTVFIPSYSYLIHTVLFIPSSYCILHIRILHIRILYLCILHIEIKQPYTELFKDHQSLVRQQIFNNKNNFYILTIFIFFMVSLRI